MRSICVVNTKSLSGHGKSPLSKPVKRAIPALMVVLLALISGAGAEEVTTPPESLASAPAVSTQTTGAVATNATLPTVRIKDITRVQGVRENQLVGLGLVVGLEGTGDGSSSQANVQMVANMLQQFGVQVDAKYLRLRNAAAVMVTATLPPFARSGDVIDATVSSMGDARSLQGGVLLQTPLQAADGNVYAVAQGTLAFGGQSVPEGRVQRTPALTARLPGGVIVEQEVAATFVQNDALTLVLTSPDFATVSRVAQAINTAVGAGTAKPLDSSAVQVTIPSTYQQNPVEFLAALEELTVTPDTPARVVINERTGTVIIGAAVRVAPVVVTHGNLSVKIGDTPGLSTTAMLGGQNQQAALLSGTSVEDVVKGLNAIGATPKDVVSMLQAIKAAGALFGELVVI